jgi:hypothetical protein
MIGKRIVKLCFCLLVLPMGSISNGQTPGSIGVGNGTLNYVVTETTNTIECPSSGGPENIQYTTTSFSQFAYTSGGVTTPLGGETATSFLTGRGVECSPPFLPSTATLTLPNGSPSNLNVAETAGRSPVISVSVSTSVDPYYKILSIIYAAPGNASSVGYTNSTSNGTTSSVSTNFSVGTATTFSFGFSKLFSAGITYGFSTSSGNTNAFQEVFTNGVSLNNAGPNSGPNTVNHNEDLFVLWLNPEITVNGPSYSLNDQSLNGQVEPFDPLEVFASEIQLTPLGSTAVTTSHLNHQFDSNTGNNDLPGMAGLCASVTGSAANPIFVAEYANNSCTLADQCGCTANDFASLMAADPFLSGNPNVTPNATTATSPENYDASGTLCNSDPQASDNCRFVLVPCSGTSCILSGPSQPGGNHESNGFVQTDATTSTETFTTSTMESTGYTVKVGLALGPSVQNTTTFTFTDSQSVGAINGVSNQLQYGLNSSTPGCSQDVIVYEDTVYHTYAMQQAPGNTSCP